MLESRLVRTLLLGALCSSSMASAQVGSITRSDSIDLLHTDLELDLRETGGALIHGGAAITFNPKVQGITQLPLDLLQLTVDSVRMDGSALAFTHAAEVLTVDLGGAFGPEDTATVLVYYHGTPVVDASGFGGFYTSMPYQYDLGVAFDAVPHSFGRSWFPCFDNFVERCTFTFHVRTNGGRHVTANGLLQGVEEPATGERLTHWTLDLPIPAYLASVAAANYATVHDAYTSITTDTIPVTLSALPGDTADMKASFIHLHEAFDGFEADFGPYRWPRVGFTLTTQGAMEHATNVCYPASLVDGGLTYERIMAHELAHHWFGNLITCSRAEEMWINEGMADLCSYMFLEKLYGREVYMAMVRTEHWRLVARLHMVDGGSYALNAVPQAFTYGEHSYRKGADVGHTLRAYLGDSLFSVGFTRVMENNAYRDISSTALRDSLIVATGVDLTHFFDDWVFQPGWATFEVDSFSTVAAGEEWEVTVHHQQKLRFAEHLYTDVPVQVMFESVSGARWTAPTSVRLSGATGQFTVTAPFAPRSVFLNDDGALALASTTVQDTIAAPGTRNLTQADLVVITSAAPAPAIVRAEEFWVAADPAEGSDPTVHVSPDRWWRITGTVPEGFNATIRFSFDGRATGTTAYDRGLVQQHGGAAFSESQLRLLYRPGPHFPWAVLPNAQVQSIGSTTDGLARVEVAGLTPGDYTFGLLETGTGMEDGGVAGQAWSLHPNPVGDILRYEAPAHVVGTELVLRDAAGRTLRRQRVLSDNGRVQLDGLPAGTLYLTHVTAGGMESFVGRVLLVR